MGLYDVVIVKCPNCERELEFQSKSGDCLLNYYEIKDCPDDVLADVNRHSPNLCECGKCVAVSIESRKGFIFQPKIIKIISTHPKQVSHYRLKK